MRAERSLIQTVGRAARNAEGKVIMYADQITASMRGAITETNRRRTIQSDYNRANGIVPKTIIKEVKNTLEITKKQERPSVKKEDIPAEIEKLKALMQLAAKDLDFEKAIKMREAIAELKRKLYAK